MLRCSQWPECVAVARRARLSRKCVAPFLAAAILFATVSAMSPAADGQTGEWAWMGGSSKITQRSGSEAGQRGVYGKKGEPAPTNVPGGRLGAVSWTDHHGNFWLFGGGGFGSTATFGFLNDMWMFDPASREWTWVSGSSSIPLANGGEPGVYGALYTPDAENTPGARTEAVGWTDLEGNLWLFGGGGFDQVDANGNLNDLWEFNPATREWAWMGGSSRLGKYGSVAGIYGKRGSFTAGSIPGSRNSAAAWADHEGNLWFFGGYGEDIDGNFGDMNDVWKYIPSQREWAWMGGSKTGEQPGVYGTRGKASATNMPGARESAAAWAGLHGNLWLFGGNGFLRTGSSVTNGFLNDVWEFDIEAGEWIWMGGSDEFPDSQRCLQTGDCGSAGIYGTLGKASAENIPGSRSSPAVWLDAEGDAWMFGGIGYDADGSGGALNDLWEFNPSANEWTWMGGSSTLANCQVDERPDVCAQPGVYGTLHEPAPGNIPGGRESAVGWTDSAGHRWLMGGDGTDSTGTVGYLGYLNDVWEYEVVAGKAGSKE
jgi:N-acetylneuraminic acid mutarotase